MSFNSDPQKPAVELKFSRKNIEIDHPMKSIQKGRSYLTQLRVGDSKLNFLKFKHSLKDTINPVCPTSDGTEDIEHFLMLCLSFDVQRRDLLA